MSVLMELIYYYLSTILLAKGTFLFFDVDFAYIFCIWEFVNMCLCHSQQMIYILGKPILSTCHKH